MLWFVLLLLSANQVSCAASSIDWRNYNNTIINQGTCNAAWALAAGNLYQIEYTMSMNGNSTFNLSNITSWDMNEVYLIDCSGYGGCRNGSLRGAIDFAIDRGLPLPGAATTGSNLNENYTNAGCSNAVSITKTARTVYNNLYFKISNLKLRQLLARAPTANEIMTNAAFKSHTGSGVFTCGYTAYQDADLDSAVVIMGYTNAGQWIVRWFGGNSWGSGGYMLLKMDQKDCGIRRRVYQISTVKWSAHYALSAILLVFALMSV